MEYIMSDCVVFIQFGLMIFVFAVYTQQSIWITYTVNAVWIWSHITHMCLLYFSSQAVKISGGLNSIVNGTFTTQQRKNLSKK